MFGKQLVIVEEYRGNQTEARKQFVKDKIRKAQKGYVVTHEEWTQGQWHIGHFIVALLLCFVLIGFLVFLYLLLCKPDGRLTVTYELQEQAGKS